MTQRQVDNAIQTSIDDVLKESFGEIDNTMLIDEAFRTESHSVMVREILQLKTSRKAVGEKAIFVKSAIGQSVRVHGVILHINGMMIALCLDDMLMNMSTYRLPTLGDYVHSNFDVAAVIDEASNCGNVMPEAPGIPEMTKDGCKEEEQLTKGKKRKRKNCAC